MSYIISDKENVNCKICNHLSEYKFSGFIRNKYNVKYYCCTNCGFLQTEEPFWLREAYKDSINLSDTGLIQRNIELSKITACLIYIFFNINGKYLDYAGGYGVFTRLMRDIGFDYYWDDIFTENLFAKGFEYNNKNNDIILLTSFESFEHFSNPIDEINKMVNITPNILFSTELIPKILPEPDKWYYYGLNHGQHISFYSLKSLEIISKIFKLNLYTNKNNLHLLTKQSINPFIFNFVLKKYKLINKYIMRKLKSKTMEDSLFLQK